MAATRARTRSASHSNGTAPGAVADAARKAGKPGLAAGAAAAGLAGGLLLGSRLGGSGLLVRRRSSRALALAGAKRLAKTAVRASNTADDIHAIREQLEQANNRSPIEVLLDGLTHRPGTKKRHRVLS